MNKFILSAESTIDMPFSYAQRRNINILFYTYMIGDEEYTDDMLRDPDALPNFYKRLEAGALPTTSQINEFTYEEYFEGILKANEGDLLHICFGTGMTKAFFNAEAAGKELSKKYPDRKIVVIDSLCSSTGYGFLVDFAADMRDEGKSIEDAEDWVLKNRRNVHHQFFSTDLSFYRRSGRMSGAAAKVGTILNICPIMRIDYDGKIIAYDKVRGIKAAIKTTIKTMEKHAVGGENYSNKCFVCHSNCLDIAKETAAAVQKKFINLRGKVQIFDIGTIIASHCGPGTVAVFFLGDERAPERVKTLRTAKGQA